MVWLWYGVVWCGVYGMVWCGVVGYGMVWYVWCMVWEGMARLYLGA